MTFTVRISMSNVEIAPTWGEYGFMCKHLICRTKSLIFFFEKKKKVMIVIYNSGKASVRVITIIKFSTTI